MPEDLAPKIAAFLADRVLDAPVNEIAKSEPGAGADLWIRMFNAFPKATRDELARGTLIAMELIEMRSAEIAAETVEIKRKRKGRR